MCLLIFIIPPTNARIISKKYIIIAATCFVGHYIFNFIILIIYNLS